MLTSPSRIIPIWYVPSFCGDIKLEAKGESTTLLIADQVTPQEKVALDKLLAEASKKGWLPGPAASLYGLHKLKTELQAPIAKVSKAIAKALKPGRKIISAVTFKDGTMEEIISHPSPSSGRRIDTDRSAATERERSADPVAAASVAAPTRGCPAPDFEKAEIKARQVLSTFLSPEQLEDFNKHNRFISTGVVTGRRYMVTSRHARDELASYHRSLFDLEAEMPLCVHDWTIPAAEEMLTLHLLLQLPNWELYLRTTEDELDPYEHLV